jgi:hypothetical protein
MQGFTPIAEKDGDSRVHGFIVYGRLLPSTPHNTTAIHGT